MPLDDPKLEAFALKLASGISKRQAAIAVGYSEKSAATIGGRLAKRPEVQARVAELAGAVTEKIVEKTARYTAKLIAADLTRRQRRIDSYDDILARLRQVVEERGAEPSMAQVPGGTSGLLVRKLKAVGSGFNQQIVSEYEADVALLRELREYKRQVAQELGELTTGGATEQDDNRLSEIVALIKHGPAKPK